MSISNQRRSRRLALIAAVATLAPVVWADSNDQDAQLMKAASMGAGKMGDSEKNLFQDSIRNAKSSVARETLDAFYQDALDSYRQGRYDEALFTLDNIYRSDPNYGDVAKLRETIRSRKKNQERQVTDVSVQSIMREGDKALRSGQKVLAISHWKKALEIDPDYAPARKKIDETNKEMARKQFEDGYMHYHHGDLEDALDSWANAIALDPKLKQQGLLLLMSKVELGVKRERVSQLAAQGFDQYQRQDFETSLKTYQEVLRLQPRHEEARRTINKIHIILGRTALESADSRMAKKDYAGAQQDYEKVIAYGYELARATKGKEIAHAKTTEKPVVVASTKNGKKGGKGKNETKETGEKPDDSQTTTTTTAPPPPPPTAKDPEGAMARYRQGMAAIRTKDFHKAIEELEAAAQLDPTDEKIYMALQRAKQEWGALNAGRGGQ